MKTITKIRGGVALLFAILLLGTTLFLGYSSVKVKDLSDTLTEMRLYEQEGREAYKEAAVLGQVSLIDSVESQWKAQLERLPYYTFEEQKEYFVQRVEEGITNRAYSSAILVIVDENESASVFYVGYQKPDYEYLSWEDIYAWDSITDKEMHIKYGDPDAPFGQLNRLYVFGTVLEYDPSNKLNVFVFFEEQIMYNSMVTTLSLDTLSGADSLIHNVLLALAVFLVYVLIVGVAIMLYLRKLYLDVNQVRCPYYGNSLCYATKINNPEKEDL